MDRRTFLHTLPGLTALGALSPPMAQAAPSVAARPRAQEHVAVVGAGAFGGWTALHLLRKGARVTLLDAWGPGNARASSGGETRVTRHAYTSRIYAEMTARALALWQENEAAWGVQIFHPTGVLFMAPDDEAFVQPAHRAMEAAGVPHQILSGEEIARRWPEINTDGLRWATWEPQMGYLLARRGCQAVVEAFQREGGDYRVAQVEPGAVASGAMGGLTLSDGPTLTADRYVFACGPWLGRVFPDVVGRLVQPTRQEVFYFGTPPGDTRFAEGRFPTWADMGSPVWYGIPGNERRGFKVALDERGPDFDPTAGERVPTPEGIEAARAYLAHRFPALAGAPLLEARVCQYEQTPDAHLLIDRHPEAANAWLVGGGSGHGYKLGPAVGEHAAARVMEEQPVEPTFRLDRFSR
jgi:monomeric sarcosine oxidase